MFYLTLAEKHTRDDGSSLWRRNYFNTGVKSRNGEITDSIRNEFIRMVRMLYCIIERMKSSEVAFERSEALAKLKLALNNDESMKEIINKAESDFPLRSDIIHIGNELKRDFQFLHTVYPSETVDEESIYGYLLQKSNHFMNAGKTATARSYRSTANSLKVFSNDKPVTLSQVTRTFLESYAAWLKNNGVSDSTQSFYLRTLRSALNYAVEEKRIVQEDNLFNGLNTKIYKGSNIAPSSRITPKILNNISSLDLSDDKETELVRDMYMFGFHCHGIELSDMLYLKKQDLIDGKLVFNRRKKGSLIEIPVDNSAYRILEKYKDSSNEYLFPLLETYKGYQYPSIRERVRQKMSKISKLAGCEALPFSSNITAWRQIISRINLSELLNNG